MWINVCCGGCKEDGAMCLVMVSSDGRRGKGHKLNYRKLILNINKNFWGHQTLEEVVQKVCRVLILGDIQNPT